MKGKGRFFTDFEISRIVGLLSSTELSSAQIARRMDCSASAVSSLNRKHCVRNYAGRRSSWDYSGSELLVPDSNSSRKGLPAV
jgi:hypothetical protein